MRFQLIVLVLCTVFLVSEAGSGCGFYKTDCIPSRKSYIEFLAEENEDQELVMVSKHEYFYATADCSGSLSMELTGNYSLVFVKDDGDDHYFDITTISQFLEFRDTHYLQIHKCKEEDIEMGIAYNPSGSIFTTSCDISFDDYSDLKKVTSGKIVIDRKTFSFPDLFLYPTETYYTGTYLTSAGCNAAEVNSFLIVVVICLILVIIGLVYYQRNYRYIPITDRKRVDLPKELA